jgi:hypothetical protein
MGRPLSLLERDLNKYTQDKVCRLILDVVQAFEIADEPKSKAVACVGATLLRVSATLAAFCNADRERWLVMCTEVYDQAQQAKKEDDDD